jgi:NADH-quinone oxidoreductase subunit N
VQPYLLILPEVVVLLAAVLALFAEVIVRGAERPAAWIGAGAAAISAVVALLLGTGVVRAFGGMLVIDEMALFARVATLGCTALFLVWLAGKGMGEAGRVREASALVLFACLGAMLMAAARDYVVLFLALETATMPAYVLIGYDRKSDRGLEGAMKYFLLSMVTSVVLLYGISFIVALSGSTALAATRLAGQGAIALVAVALVSVGLLAKLSAAPFHYWSPDAYAGAPVQSVAFVSSVPKIAATVALARLSIVFSHQVPGYPTLIAAVAILSMVLGNLAAYPQKDLRRLMAYSGIAHAGYLLVGLAALGSSNAGAKAAVVYSLLYALPSMGVMFVAAEGGLRLEEMAGLARRRPALAWALAVFAFSLIGIPPLAGFFGKVYLFAASLDAGLVVLTVIGVVMSAVSAGFYFRIVRAAFLEDAASVPIVDPSRTVAADVAVWACVAATVVLGLVSGPLLGMLGAALP